MDQPDQKQDPALEQARRRQVAEALRDHAGATLVFDLDGTLVETAPDLMRALNHVLHNRGLPEIELKEIRQLVGQGARKMIERGLSFHGKDPDAVDLDALTDEFVVYYKANIAVASVPFEGAVAVIDGARDAGLKIGLCTNKKEDLARHLMSCLGLADRFDAIVGGDTLTVRKPDPAPILAAIERASGRKDQAVMIGDSPPDIDAAKAAGVPSIAVSFGYTAVPPTALGANCVIDHFDELVQALPPLLRQL